MVAWFDCQFQTFDCYCTLTICHWTVFIYCNYVVIGLLISAFKQWKHLDNLLLYMAYMVWLLVQNTWLLLHISIVIWHWMVLFTMLVCYVTFCVECVVEPSWLLQGKEISLQHQQGLWLWLSATPRPLLLLDCLRHRTDPHPRVSWLALFFRWMGKVLPPC